MRGKRGGERGEREARQMIERQREREKKGKRERKKKDRE